jgi:hypothetical protein
VMVEETRYSFGERLTSPESISASEPEPVV